MTRPAHPGTVVFVDEAAHSQRVLPVAQVPEAVAWGLVDGAPAPVVRVVATTVGARRELHSFAADGRLLSTTFQRATPGR